MNKKLVSILLAGSLFVSGTALAFSDISGHWAEMAIKSLKDSNIISGYEDGTFRPNNYITREEAIQVMSNYIGGASPNTPVPVDAKGRWSTPAIQNLLSKGLITGYPDGTIQPEKNITRVEFATIVCSYLDSESKLFSSLYSFNDIEDSWGFSYIALLSGNNVISGYPDGNFRPDNPITRAEAIKIMSNFDNISDVGISPEERDFIFTTKDYIRSGQNHLSKAESLNWSNSFLNALTERELIDVYKNYLSYGGKQYDVLGYGQYLTNHAPSKPDWKKRFEEEFYNIYPDEVIVDYVHVEGEYYRVIVENFGSFVKVNSITGYYHG